MPPVMMTGVIASASNPTSTNNRVISKALVHDQKFRPIAANTAISATSTVANTTSCVIVNRRSTAASLSGDGDDMAPPSERECIGSDGDQNDRSFERFGPIRLSV